MPNPKATPFCRPEPEVKNGWVRKCDMDDCRLRKLRDDMGGSVPSNTQYGWITA
ncbi:MAG: hypothetical protein L0212_11865 [Acidobacteria bacterium]|nr:hypothetical protein [Acidobacteriota bacterium]